MFGFRRVLRRKEPDFMRFFPDFPFLSSRLRDRIKKEGGKNAERFFVYMEKKSIPGG